MQQLNSEIFVVEEFFELEHIFNLLSVDGMDILIHCVAN